MAELVQVSPLQYKRETGKVLPPLAAIGHTGRTEFTTAVIPLWNEASAAQGKPFPAAAAFVYHTANGKRVILEPADSTDPEAVPVKHGKRGKRLVTDLGAVMAKFGVEAGFDFHYLAPVTLAEVEGKGQCLVLEMGTALRPKSRRRAASPPDDEAAAGRQE